LRHFLIFTPSQRQRASRSRVVCVDTEWVGVLSAIHDRSQLHMHVGDISRTKASRPSTEKGPCRPFAWAFSVKPSVRQEQSAAKRHGSFPGGDVCDAAAVRTFSSLPGQNSRLTRLTTVGWLTALSRSQLQSRIDVTANRIVPFTASNTRNGWSERNWIEPSPRTPTQTVETKR
jgi:hypothetical protein